MEGVLTFGFCVIFFAAIAWETYRKGKPLVGFVNDYTLGNETSDFVNIEEFIKPIANAVLPRGYDVDMRDYHNHWATPFTLRCAQELFNMSWFELFKHNKVHKMIALDFTSRVANSEMAFLMETALEADQFRDFLGGLARQRHAYALRDDISEEMKRYVLNMISHLVTLFEVFAVNGNETYISENHVFNIGMSIIDGFEVQAQGHKYFRPSYYYLPYTQFLMRVIQDYLHVKPVINRQMHKILAFHNVMQLPCFTMLIYEWGIEN